MNVWQHCAILLATKNRESLRSLYDNPRSAGEEMGAFYDFEISKIYDEEARRLPFLSWIYRFASERRIDSAIISSRTIPGPYGARALKQLAEGEFSDGIENLRIETERLTRWIAVSEVVDPSDRIRLCNYLNLGGAPLSELGQFKEARNWLTQALEAFDQMPSEIRVDLANLKESAVLRMVLCLQLERKYEEAVSVIEMWLDNFTFTAFPTEGRKTLMAAKAVLEDFAPLVSGFSDGESTLEILGDYMEKIQELDSFEAARKLRHEIILRFRREGADIRIKQMGDAAISDIKRQEELFASLSKQEDHPLGKPELLSEDEIDEMSNPHLREMAIAQNKQAEESFAMMERLQKSSAELSATCKSFRDAVDSFSIFQIQAIKERVYKVPFVSQVSWLRLELWRVLVQLLVLSYMVDKVLEDLIHRGGEHLWRILRMEDRKGLLAATILVVMLLIGKLIEKRIDKAEMKHYRANLIRLVRERSETVWTSYNGLVNIARNAREGLEQVQLSFREWEREDAEFQREDEERQTRLEALKRSLDESRLRWRDL